MNFFGRACSGGRFPYLAATGELSPRERLEFEAHAASCPRCTEALRDGVALDIALRRAYTPLARRRALLAPGRVRVALGPPPRRAPFWRMPALVARLAEVSVALGVTMFVLSGSLEEPPAAVRDQAPRSVIQEYFRGVPPTDDVKYFRWLRLQPAPVARVEPVRFPAGGRYDVDPVEILALPTSTPH